MKTMTPENKSCGTCRHGTLRAYLSPCKECIAARTIRDAHPLWEDANQATHLVYVSGKGQPTMRHGTLAEAKTEAERLAKLNPNHKVYVVKVVATCTTETVTKWETKVAQ